MTPIFTRIALVSLLLAAASASGQDKPQGSTPDKSAKPGTTDVLPLPDYRYTGSVGRTIDESDPPQFPQPTRPPKGAPNIVFILIDDAGYGQFDRGPEESSGGARGA